MVSVMKRNTGNKEKKKYIEKSCLWEHTHEGNKYLKKGNNEQKEGEKELKR